MKAKRYFAVLLALAMMLGILASCKETGDVTSNTPESEQPSQQISQDYPITPEELGSGEVKWSEEETADGWMKVTNAGGETLGYSPDSGVELIQVEGLAFKDLNRNGLLDQYEDWRLDDNTRAADLAAQLPLESIFGLMLHVNIDGFESDGSDAAAKFGVPFSELMDAGVRSGLNQVSGSFPANILATWNNNAQAYAESLDYGIPVMVSTNPNTMGFADNLALAATFDGELVSEVYQATAKLYRAAAITILLGPQVDLATEPRWNRISGTFGEDPALSVDLTNAAISALQSSYAEDGTDLGWGSDSVIAMMKHWPGDGAGEAGRESHSASGKYTVYPGDGFELDLSPFVAGALNLDSITGSAAAAMASYSIAYSDSEEYGELVGSAYSEWKINLLRETYGFDGVVCTDWGALGERGWGLGVEGAEEAEALELMLLAGVNQIGDLNEADFAGAYELLKEDLGEEEAETLIRESGRRVLKLSFQAGVFDNAYLVVKETSELYNDSDVEALKAESQVKSIVMLKNADNAIQSASGEKPTVYIPLEYNAGSWSPFGSTAPSASLPVDQQILDGYFNVVTDKISDTLTGEPDEDGNPTLAQEDIIRASASELANCDFALIFVDNPANEGEEGTGFGHDYDTDEYFPISLQYGDYVANSQYIRSPSISGDLVEGHAENVYGTMTTLEKEDRSYYGASARITNASELDKIQNAVDNMPEGSKIIVAVNADRPMIFSEFEDDVDAILIGFGVDNSAFLDIAAGKVEPSGLLPLQMPANMETVEAQLEDIPRDMECYVDSEGNTYDFAFGLNWSGVISDERTAKYDVPVITSLEEALNR